MRQPEGGDLVALAEVDQRLAHRVGGGLERLRVHSAQSLMKPRVMSSA